MTDFNYPSKFLGKTVTVLSPTFVMGIKPAIFIGTVFQTLIDGTLYYSVHYEAVSYSGSITLAGDNKIIGLGQVDYDKAVNPYPCLINRIRGQSFFVCRVNQAWRVYNQNNGLAVGDYSTTKKGAIASAEKALNVKSNVKPNIMATTNNTTTADDFKKRYKAILSKVVNDHYFKQAEKMAYLVENAKPITFDILPGYQFFVGKTWKYWYVWETVTGTLVSRLFSQTRKEAISHAESILKSNKDKMDAAMESTLKTSGISPRFDASKGYYLADEKTLVAGKTTTPPKAKDNGTKPEPKPKTKAAAAKPKKAKTIPQAAQPDKATTTTTSSTPPKKQEPKMAKSTKGLEAYRVRLAAVMATGKNRKEAAAIVKAENEKKRLQKAKQSTAQRRARNTMTAQDVKEVKSDLKNIQSGIDSLYEKIHKKSKAKSATTKATKPKK